MEKELDEELNWFAEEPIEGPALSAPTSPPSQTLRSSGGSKNSGQWPNRTDRLKSNRITKKNEEAVADSKKLPTEDKEKIEDDPPIKITSNLTNKIAKTAEEKLYILEERDKLIRASLEVGKLTSGKPSVHGVCPDMCPEKERILRDVRGIVSSYEAFPGSNQMDHAHAVKEYARSSADQDEPLPHELRPIPVLRMTMDYLIVHVMCDLDKDSTGRTLESVCYDFCWGRLRAIRKDIIQQQLCDLNTVTILEECARFHICCFDRMWGTPKSVFDDKINLETLMNCLKSLMYMYEDLRKQRKSCPNEAEFQAYMIILKLQQGFVLSEFPFNLRSSAKIREAVDIHTAYNNNMYSTYFTLVKKTSYLNACIMQRFFGYLRTRAIEVIVKSHCPPKPNQSIKLSVAYMAHTLKFDNHDDCITFCEAFGLTLSRDATCFMVARNDFFLPETMFTETKSSSLVVNKRIPIAQSVLGHKEQPIILAHHVHSSFNKDHSLKSAALDASDQEEKLLRDNVERSLLLRKSPPILEADSGMINESDMNLESQHLEDELQIGQIQDDVDMSPAMPYAEDEEIEVDDVGQVCDSNSSAVTLDEEEGNDTQQSDAQPSSDTSTSIYDESVQSSDSDSLITIDETDCDSFNITPQLLTPLPAMALRKASEEAPRSPFVFPSTTPSNKVSPISYKPISIASPLKSPESSSCKKFRTEPHKFTQKAKMEYENKVLMSKLRKKLSENMKHVTARKFALIWKSKVERSRNMREHEGVALQHITVENHLKLWGCPGSYKGRTQERLVKRKKANVLVTALLHLNVIDQLDGEVKQVGPRIAETLGQVAVKWANHYGNISQPQPVFWKLVISLPARSVDGAFFPDRLRYWCRTAFNSCLDSSLSDLCCFFSSSGVPVFIHPIIVEGLEDIERHCCNLSAALLVRAEGWEHEKKTEKRLVALKSVANGGIALAVLTLGNELPLINMSPQDRDVFFFAEHSKWVDTNSLISSLINLAQAHRMENFKILPFGFLLLMTVENFLDALHQDMYLNDDLCDSLIEPNAIIRLYNSLVDKLEEEISLCCFFNYYGLACELEQLVKKLKYTHDLFPASYNKAEDFMAALRSYTFNLKLETLPWKFADSVQLVNELKQFCQKAGCPHLLSQLVRTINPPDSDSGVDLSEYLKDVQWLSILEMVIKELIRRDAYSFKVVYREDKVRELISSHWWLYAI
ncbi:SAC3/GANP/Nin1/mts3/eIF-3 p25 family [Nesidiocoris tenuis]|uniref:SAC3/GANP/Nin1/mts3/eIF-3 p25 family n=1 Tax=Nesidiocoris tenuis TaxID=355587 RepID=A0ABN7AVA7_9HEMI|nr:SAC3/GANP/Nin1/mts3/eIF-3 p25 family [Nesidiocoris tenuis]